MTETKRAVVIGINKYTDGRIHPLKGAVNDAQDIYDRLTKSGGFEIKKEHFLLDEEATSSAIRKAISDLLWKVDRSALSLLYFSGHGFQDEYGNGYIGTHDIDSTEPLVCGIRMQELTEHLLKAKNKDTILFVLDCCYSGIATEGKGGDVPFQENQLEQWFSALENQSTGKGKIILASSRKDQKSREMVNCSHEIGFDQPHDHGAFTFHFLEGLDGKAAQNEAVTLHDIHTYIERQMQNDAQHTMSFYGAGVTQAEHIVIGRASQWRQINELLKEAEDLLNEDSPLNLFGATKAIGTVVAICPRLERACDLRESVNRKLSDHSISATNWLLAKRLEIGLKFSQTFRRLQELAANLSVETILSQDPATIGLLMSLCEVACEIIREDVFLSQLSARSSAERRQTNLTKPDAPGYAKKID